MGQQASLNNYPDSIVIETILEDSFKDYISELGLYNSRAIKKFTELHRTASKEFVHRDFNNVNIFDINELQHKVTYIENQLNGFLFSQSTAFNLPVIQQAFIDVTPLIETDSYRYIYIIYTASPKIDIEIPRYSLLDTKYH